MGGLRLCGVTGWVGMTVRDGVTGGGVGCKRVTRGVGLVSDRVVKRVDCVCDGITGGGGCGRLTRSGVGCDRATCGFGLVSDRAVKWVGCVCDGITRGVGYDRLTSPPEE